MYSLRTLTEVVGHKLWLAYSSLLFSLWRRTGLRPHYLSSKGQDRWVSEVVFPRTHRGFFLEIGAGNGFIGSDTFVLEQDFGWSGICIEANPLLFETLKNTVQRRCTTVNTCIDESRRPVQFILSGDTSGIVADDTDNSFAMRREKIRRLNAKGHVRTLDAQPIAEILKVHGAPPIIDYFSLDVEGAEERIIKSFPFDAHRVLAMTVERPTNVLHDVLRAAGLVMVRQHMNDGFYLHQTLLSAGDREKAPVFRRKQF